MRVEAHKVYNEFIQDRHHIHMNSTKWLTLSEYVKYLGKEGICTVEESPKGWFIRLVQREPADVRPALLLALQCSNKECRFFGAARTQTECSLWPQHSSTS